VATLGAFLLGNLIGVRSTLIYLAHRSL
jgi:hypothetical protein